MKKIVSFLGILIGFVLVGLISYKYIAKILPNYQQASMQEMIPTYEKGNISVVIEDRIIDVNYSPKLEGDNIYLPIDLINEYIDPYYYWDANEKTLTYTTGNKVIRMKNEELTYFVNNEPLELDMPIMTFDTKMAYLPIHTIVSFSDIQIKYNKELELIVIDYVDEKYKEAEVIKDKTYVRLDTDIKSKIVRKLNEKDTVRLYEQTATGWVKVRTNTGLLGYVKKSSLGNIQDIYPNIVEEDTTKYNSNKNIKGKINIAWHQVTNVSANNGLRNKLEGVKGLDVISPTWFSIKNSEGDISNIASKEYIKYAKEQGYQVWALFSNRFDKKITHDVLSSTKKREKVIKQILALTSIYELDGINVDFENVAKEDGANYVQFIRELTPYLKSQDVVVSVDMYVPSPWTAHYNRSELGKVVDYLIIMAYDEHWSTSPESGSVASIGFVEKGIEDTLIEVPKEKVILGLPYYTRLWKEEYIDGELNVSSQAYTMKKARQVLEDNNSQIIWNDKVKQYYGDYKDNNITYKIWLEEERSIEEKVKLAIKYDLVGVSGWKIGLEKEEIWDILVKYLNK
ncbi:MAG: glycosyl hydrolase family 18 protein [Vallitalea sp.]|jgi:spore germination protein YaaH|nr:glycosyl hydrolase family 18 protein [Vallitalea sp.]